MAHGEKGGIGKTTTTVILDATLVEVGRRVLLLGADPQAPVRAMWALLSLCRLFPYVALTGQTSPSSRAQGGPTLVVFPKPLGKS